jgi:uncharacterized RDD family membrane protein YckC
LHPRLDSLLPRETPEGASLLLRPAGALPRGAAWAIDFLLRLAVFWVSSMVLTFSGKAGTGLLLILAFSLEFFYPVVFEVWRKGATPGKNAMGLAVVMDTGAPVTFAASFTRNLLRIVDFLPFGYLFGVITILLNRECRRLGDITARTVVIHRAKPKVDVTPPGREWEPMAPRFALTREETQQLAEFARRVPALTPARAEELALILPPLTQGAHQSAQDRTTALLSIAARDSKPRDKADRI